MAVSRKDRAEDVIRTQMRMRGVPDSHWEVMTSPARLCYFGPDTEGKGMESFPIDRRWSVKRLNEWIEKHVKYKVSEGDLPA